MNDLVYVMYNLKLKSRQTRKNIALPFEDMKSDDEWITKEGDDIFYEDNLQVEQEQPLGESGSGSSIDLVGGSLTDPTLDAFDIDNLEIVELNPFHIDHVPSLQATATIIVFNFLHTLLFPSSQNL
ncbi:hypothetical protein JHK87_047846 [Glycine soja]|nr:hypothetical protein JHK87_047846 [Glycine soja]